MSDWKIGLTPQASEKTPTIIGPLTALIAWKRLTKPMRAAVEAAYPDGLVKCHPNTLYALERHGFVRFNTSLTDAGKAVAKWCVKP